MERRESGFGAQHGPRVTEEGQQTATISWFPDYFAPSVAHGEPTCAGHMGGKKLVEGSRDKRGVHLFRLHPRFRAPASGLYARANNFLNLQRFPRVAMEFITYLSMEMQTMDVSCFITRLRMPMLIHIFINGIK